MELIYLVCECVCVCESIVLIKVMLLTIYRNWSVTDWKRKIRKSFTFFSFAIIQRSVLPNFRITIIRTQEKEKEEKKKSEFQKNGITIERLFKWTHNKSSISLYTLYLIFTAHYIFSEWNSLRSRCVEYREKRERELNQNNNGIKCALLSYGKKRAI